MSLLRLRPSEVRNRRNRESSASQTFEKWDGKVHWLFIWDFGFTWSEAEQFISTLKTRTITSPRRQNVM
jgi:hypothetical protein